MRAKLQALARFSIIDFLLLRIPSIRRDIETTKRYCDIGSELHEWIIDTNRPPPCWSEDGRALVRSYIIAYLDFLDAHRFLKRNDEYLEMLLGWLVPFPYHPPPSPKRKRTPLAKGRRSFCKSCLVCYSNEYATISRKSILTRRRRGFFGTADFRASETLRGVCQKCE